MGSFSNKTALKRQNLAIRTRVRAFERGFVPQKTTNRPQKG
jgi:hypothetical protein